MSTTYEEVQKSQVNLGEAIFGISKEIKDMGFAFNTNSVIRKRYVSQEQCEQLLSQAKQCQQRLNEMQTWYHDILDEAYLDSNAEDITDTERQTIQYIKGIQPNVFETLKQAADTISRNIAPIQKDLNDIQKNNTQKDMSKETIPAMHMMNAQKNMQYTFIECMRNLEKTLQHTLFARPTEQKEIEEQNEIWAAFEHQNSHRYPGLPIMYHATTIGNAYQILTAEEISSSVDRLGYATSLDPKGIISVTTPEHVFTSLSYLRDDTARCIPNGVMFAISMKPEEKENAMRTIANNIDLTEPGRLIGIITDRENIDGLKENFAEYEDLLYTPDEFCETRLRQIAMDLQTNAPEIFLMNGKTAQILSYNEKNYQHVQGEKEWSLDAEVLIDGMQYNIEANRYSGKLSLRMTKSDNEQKLQHPKFSYEYDNLHNGDINHVKENLIDFCNQFFEAGAINKYVTDDNETRVDDMIYIAMDFQQHEDLYNQTIGHCNMLKEPKTAHAIIDGLFDTFVASYQENSDRSIQTNNVYNQRAAEIYYDLLMHAHDQWVVNNIKTAIVEPDMQDKFYKLAPIEGVPFAELKEERECVDVFINGIINNETRILNNRNAEVYLNTMSHLDKDMILDVFKANQHAYKSSTKNDICKGLKEYYSEIGVSDKLPKNLMEHMVTKIASQSLEQLKPHKTKKHADLSRQ